VRDKRAISRLFYSLDLLPLRVPSSISGNRPGAVSYPPGVERTDSSDHGNGIRGLGTGLEVAQCLRQVPIEFLRK
jgi:hypothetical protein